MLYNNQQSISTLQEKIDAQNREYKQLSESVVRAHTELNTSKTYAKLNEVDEKIRDLIKQSDESIKQIGEIKAHVKQTRKLNQKTDKTYKSDKIDYKFKKIYSEDTEKKQYPSAWAMYHPDKDTWDTGTYPQDINIRVTQTTQQTGSLNSYIEAYVTNDQMDETRGIKFPLSIKSAEFLQIDLTKPHFMWAPSLDIGGMIDMYGDAFAIANVSLFGYGKLKSDLQWRFVSFGIGGNKEFTGQFSPVMYNLSNIIPFVNDLYVAPYATINTKGKVGFAIGITTRF